ncbi:MAG TPA: hypothetical protein ENH07_06460, partial [Nitrospirae bacterium]|nr:hypothetical protein [Nitrospirota bacterium]
MVLRLISIALLLLFLVSCKESCEFIVFSSDRDGDFDLYAVRPDGTDLRRLTDNAWNDRYPSISPEGLIAFIADRYGKDDIYLMKIDGTDLKRLTFNAENRY